MVATQIPPAQRFELHSGFLEQGEPTSPGAVQRNEVEPIAAEIPSPTSYGLHERPSTQSASVEQSEPAGLPASLQTPSSQCNPKRLLHKGT